MAVTDIQRGSEEVAGLHMNRPFSSRRPSGAPAGVPLHSERRLPEQTTLYHLVQQHAASLIAHAEASTGSELLRFIEDEFDAFLECGILAPAS